MATTGTARAGALRYCDEPPPLDAAQQARMLRLADIVKAELDASGARVALVARSGLDLDRFGQRYSHAGFSLKASPETPWAVRQLYFACDERRPRLYDQGLAAFLLGMQSPLLGYVSVLLLPPAAAAAVERAALDKRLALQLLAGDYSANAYPYSQRYQNCNQWVAEMLASAWGGGAWGDGAWGDGVWGDGEPSRAAAQRWLRQQGYEPTVFEGSRPLFWLSTFLPWLHRDDHPVEDLEAARYRVSMPASLQAFVQRREPDTRRLEICHDQQRVVVRRGGAPFPAGCVPEAGDTDIPLD
ncbi:MAG: DUF2145 domain-containing protein [Rubrivivax sp.]|nr:DUF2145 domain-containing protein [Rubrivivax sp.]